MPAAAVLAIAVALLGAGGHVAASSAHTTASSTAIRAVLLRTPERAAAVSPQARQAIELALGWPAPTARGIHVLHQATAPVGPWLVQRTEIVNENLSDEGSDVEVETLVNPITGHLDAAWFYGL